jgi:mannosyltransferase
MAVTQGVRESADAARRDASGDDARVPGTPLADLADRAMRVPWLWPALLTLIIGSYQLGRPELWRDELSSWTFATRPVPDLFATVRHTDAAQLPYYLLLHYWIAAFGDSAVVMRSLSVLAMAGAAACVTLAGRRLAGSRAGLLAGLVFAVVPSVSRFAQEIRPYALEILVATLATLLLLRAIDQPGVRRWAAYGACLAVLGYVDLVALALVTGHAAGVGLRWWRDRDKRLLWFGPAVLAGLAACLPLAVVSWGEAGGQVGWIPRPRLTLSAFSFFARNLFFSTSVAAAFILLAILAWTADRQAAAFATALALLPVAAVWLVSQGAHSYFFPRYLLLTVGGWAILAGVGLARVDVRAAAVVVVVLALLGAGDQQVIRSAGAHNWAFYPVGSYVVYPDYAGAAALIAREARAGDGIVYPANNQEYLMIGLGVQYYLERDLPHRALVPHQLFLGSADAQLHHLYPQWCTDPAACLGPYPRVWVVVSGNTSDPYANVLAGQAAVLRAHYRLGSQPGGRHGDRSGVQDLSVFLLVSS